MYYLINLILFSERSDGKVSPSNNEDKSMTKTKVVQGHEINQGGLYR